MTYEFRQRSVRDYDHIPRGLGTPEMQLKLKCALLGMKLAEDRLGRDHAFYLDFRNRAIGWAEKLGLTPEQAGIE